MFTHHEIDEIHDPEMTPIELFAYSLQQTFFKELKELSRNEIQKKLEQILEETDWIAATN